MMARQHLMENIKLGRCLIRVFILVCFPLLDYTERHKSLRRVATVNPLAAAVARTTKPPLITAHHLLAQSRSVHRLIEAEEPCAVRNLVGVRTRGVGYCQPGP